MLACAHHKRQEMRSELGGVMLACAHDERQEVITDIGGTANKVESQHIVKQQPVSATAVT